MFEPRDPTQNTWIGRRMAEDERWQGYRPAWPWADEIPHPSEILRTKDRQWEPIGGVYNRMRRCGDLVAFALRRSTAVRRLPYSIETARAPRRLQAKAEQAAELCRYVLGERTVDSLQGPHRQLKIWPQAIQDHVETSRDRGSSRMEIVWERLQRGPKAGALVPVDLFDVALDRFAYLRMPNGRAALHVRRWDADSKIFGKVPAPVGKFITTRFGGTCAWGGPGLYDYCYDSWFQLFHIDKTEMVDMERFGSPSVGAEYDTDYDNGHQQDDDDERGVEHDADEVARNAAGLDRWFSHPNKIKPYHFERKGSRDLHFEVKRTARVKTMARLYAGEVATAGLRGNHGSFASDRIHDGLRQEPIIIDAEDLMAAAGQLCAFITFYNFGPDVPPPLYVCDLEQLDDQERRQKAAEKAADRGLITIPQYRRIFGLRKPGPDDEMVPARQSSQPEPTTDNDKNDGEGDPAADPPSDQGDAE